MKIVFSLFVTISLVVLTQSVPAPGFNYFFTSSHPAHYYRFPVYYHSPPTLPYYANPIWRYAYNIIPAFTPTTKTSNEPVNPPKVEELSQEILPEVMLKEMPKEVLPEKEITIQEGIPDGWLH